MANAQYDIYIASVFSLSRTMVIKHEAVADAINADLMSRPEALDGDPRFMVNPVIKTGWKYYLNLSGQYHPSDTLMSVTSQDTLQTINFTVANLIDNTATAEAYAPGGRYFKDLLARYPTQEQLIRGILNPVDISTAIAAEDGDVLWYDSALVEDNEMDLIGNLAAWAKNFQKRYFVKGYCDVDDLYLAGYLGVFYSQLPARILGLRLKYCHTYQTHSFHITQFLASNGKLDEFVSSLTKSQMLWLYRNIRYIQRNPGRQQTFQTLIDQILTARSLPLSDWTMRHELSQTQNSLAPAIEFQRGPLNLALSDGGTQVRNVREMLIAELPVAKDNAADTDAINDVTTTMSYSQSDNLATKVLESSVLDLTDATPYTLSDCLLNHWMYFASIGKYTAVVQVNNPLTGDLYTLSSSDAFVVFMYAFMTSKGLTIDTIPDLYASKVRKLVTPPIAEIRNLIDMAVVDESDLAAVYYQLPPIARTYISISSFNSACRAIHQSEIYQHAIFSTQGHLWKRAYMELATLYLYQDVECDLGAGQNYAAWFQSRGLDVPLLDADQLDTLATAILVQATGANLAVVESLADLQSAMLRLMARLSSYSVQFLASINTSPIKVIERATIRLGDVEADGTDDTLVAIPYGDLTDVNGSGSDVYTGVSISDISIFGQDGMGAAEFCFSPIVRLDGGVEVTGVERVPMPKVGIGRVTDNLSDVLGPNVNIDTQAYLPVGLHSLPEAFTTLTLDFYQLTDDDKSVLQDRYLAWLEANGTPIGNLSDSLVNLVMPPFID